MQTLQKIAAVLILPAIAYLGGACDGTDAPTETAAPAETPSFSSNDRGGKFLLGGNARLDQDPENPANDVIRISTLDPPAFGTISRRVNVKIDKLDNMLEFKARFTTPKTCIGGAPRLQLAIDRDGDGDSDGNAFGYFGPSPSFTACLVETWLYEDLTGPGDFFITGAPLFPSLPQLVPPNEELEWDLTQFGGSFYNTWSQVEVFFGANPRHLVCTVALVDDTFGAPGQTGTAHYDLFSAGRATFVDRSDIGGRGFARGCGERDDDDDDDDD